MSVEAKATKNHDEIQHWVEEREGKPGRVKDTGLGNTATALIIDFPGHTGEDSIEDVSWQEFFDEFEREDLVFVYKDDTATGERSLFCKIVDKEKAREYE